MLSLPLARELRDAGLQWTPNLHDFFAIPDRGMDERVFVITDMMAYVESLRGQPAILFNGAVEWALDYILITELVWLPTEEQVRVELERRLVGEELPTLTLASTIDGYRCEIQFQGEPVAFDAFGAREAYAQALLHILQEK